MAKVEAISSIPRGYVGIMTPLDLGTVKILPLRIIPSLATWQVEVMQGRSSGLLVTQSYSSCRLGLNGTLVLVALGKTFQRDKVIISCTD
jgi:hypothetical protein